MARESTSPPASSIATQHLRASWWIPRLRDPCADFVVRTFAAGCFGTCRLGADRMPGKWRRGTVRAAKDSASVSGCYSKKRLSKPCSRTRKQKAPGWASEGVRVPRRSGRPISGRGSVVVCAVVAPHAWIAEFLRQRACVRIAMEARCVERVGGAESGFHAGDSAGMRGGRCSAAAMGAHVTPVFFRLQTFFSQIDRWIEAKREARCAKAIDIDASSIIGFAAMWSAIATTARTCGHAEVLQRKYYFSSGASAGQTWSRSFGCAAAVGCRRSAWNARSSIATGSSRNGRNAVPCCCESSRKARSKPRV